MTSDGNFANLSLSTGAVSYTHLCIKHQVYGVFELLVILTDFHGIDELNEGGEVLLLHRSLIMDIL